MRHDIWIGIDIGKSGAIVIRNAAGDAKGVVTTHKMPLIGKELDKQELYRILKPYSGLAHAVFEKIVPFKENKSTAFSMGDQSGAVEMACISLNITFTKVLPQAWQKEMFEGVEVIYKPVKKVPGENKSSTPQRDTKAMALIAAKRLFPDVKLTFGERATVPHDGMVDGLLMSEYCRRKLA